jgi:hypothetical protein
MTQTTVKYRDIVAILDLPVDIVMSRILIARSATSQTLQKQLWELQ